jgi:hypothetical protein
LKSLFRINNIPNYWINHRKEKQELIELYESQKHKLEELDITWEIKKDIKNAYAKFLEK